MSLAFVCVCIPVQLVMSGAFVCMIRWKIVSTKKSRLKLVDNHQ